MIIKSGTYTGTGASLTVSGLGFQPDLVIVKDSNRTNDTWFKTTEMPAAFSIPIRADLVGDTNHITAITSDGFTVSSDAAVSTSGNVINYVAIKNDGDGYFSTVSYTGDNTDDKLVFSGFQPDFALLKSNSAIVGAQKFYTMASATGNQNSNLASPNYQGASDRTDLIYFGSDGMRVSNGSNSGGNLVNVNGVAHYGWVFKSKPGVVKTGNYTGNGSAGRSISGVGFTPSFVDVMASQGGYQSVTQYKSQQASGNTQPWDGSQITGKISGVNSDGFVVSADSNVNGSGTTYWWMALTDVAPVVAAPVANFTASTQTPYTTTLVQFTDTSTNTPTSWAWNFGDGTTSTLQNPTKTYTTAGTYTVSLTATNSIGNNTNTKTNYMTVTTAPSGAFVIQSGAATSATNYVNQQTIAYPSAVTAGNTLIVAIATTAAALNDITSITDNRNNTWVKASSYHASTDRSIDIWYAANSVAGTTTLTINSNNYTQKVVRVFEIQGLYNPLTLTGPVNVGDSAYVNTHTATIDGTGKFIFGAFAGTNGTTNYSAPSGTTAYSGAGDSTNLGVGINLTGGSSFTLNADQYEQGGLSVIAFNLTAPAPVTPPPGPNYTPNWYPYGVLPTGKTVTQLRTITQNWWTNNFKKYIITTGMPSGMTAGAMRVYRPENQNDTVSEGMGYALIAAVWMSDYDPQAQFIFDSLYKYVKYYADVNGLMKWHIDSSGAPLDNYSATDADYDIAWGLYLAAQKWGSSGNFNYTTERDAYLNAVLTYDHYSATNSNTALRNVMVNGDGWDPAQDGSANFFDPDYTAPMYYTAWAALNSRWTDIKNANYPIYASTDNYNTGLIPDRMTRQGTAASGQSYISGYNAVRRFRQVADYLNLGSTRATPYVDYYQHKHLADFMATQSSNNPANYYTEWAIDGSSHSTYTNSLFASSYMVTMLINSDHAQLASDTIDWIVAHPDGSYFGDTVAFMGLATAAGYQTATAPQETLNTDYFHIAFSAATPNYNRAHTTDTVKRKSYVKAHTTDVLKRIVTTKNHTTDVLKRITLTRAHTTDTLKRKAFSVVQSTDVNKKKAGIVKTHTTDYLTVKFKRTNLIYNPEFKYDYLNSSGNLFNTWTNSGTATLQRGTGLSSPDPNHTISQAAELVNSAANSDSYIYANTYGGLKPNTDYTFSAFVYVRSFTGPSFGSRGLLATNAAISPVVTSTIDANTPVGQWIRQSVTINTGSGTTLQLRLYAIQGTIDWWGAMLEEGSTPNYYFSGDYGGGGQGYFWRGANDNSPSATSILRFTRSHSTDIYLAPPVISNTTWYFDASDGAIVNNGNSWTSPASVFDGSTTTAGSSGNFNTSTSGYLEAPGTNSPTTGGSISQVQARLYAQGGNGNYPNWSSYVTLTAPSGGWTWQKVNDLVIRFTSDPGDTKSSGGATGIISSGGTQVGTISWFPSSGQGPQSILIYQAEVLVTANTALPKTKTQSTDVLKRTVATRLHQTDVLKRRTASLTHSTGVNKRLAGIVKTHTTDALKRAVSTRAQSTDVLKRKAFTRAHSTDTIRRLSTGRYHTTDVAMLFARRLNYIPNPNFESDVVGNGQNPGAWTSYVSNSGTPTYEGVANDYAAYGTKSFKVAASSVVGQQLIYNFPYATAGETYTFSAYVRTDSNVTNAVIGIYDGGNYSTTNVAANNNGRIFVTRTVSTTGTISLFMGLGVYGSTSSGTVWFDGVQLEKSATPTPYFDGDSINAGWRGTPAASTSYSLSNVYTKTQTTDVVKRATSVKTHTTDIAKRVRAIKLHTTDTVLRKSITRAHNTDVFVRSLQKRLHSTDVLKRAVFSKTHTTDTVRRLAASKNHVTDVLKRKATAKTHTTDAILRKVYVKAHSTDAFLRATVSRAHNTDINKRKAGLTRLQSTDVLKRAAFVRAHNTDVNRRLAGAIKAHSTDVLRELRTTRAHSTDTVLRRTYPRVIVNDDFTATGVSGWSGDNGAGVVRNTMYYRSAPAGLQISGGLSDSAASKPISMVVGRKYYVSMWVFAGSGTNIMVAVDIPNNYTSSFVTTNGTWQQIQFVFTAQTASSTLRAYSPTMAQMYAIDDVQMYEAFMHNTDVNKRKGGTLVHTTDTNKRKLFTRVHSTDINKLKSGNVRVHQTDVNKRAVFIKAHSTDLVKRAVRTVNHSTDGLLRKINTRAQSTDVLKRSTNVKTHTTDTFKRARLARIHTTDTSLRSGVNKFHTTDVLLRATKARAHSTDINKRAALVKQHSTDVLKRQALSRSHTTDVNKRKFVVKAHSTDVVLRATKSRVHSTDTLKRAIQSKTQSTDVFKRSRYTLAHTTDTVKRAVQSKVHTTDVAMLFARRYNFARNPSGEVNTSNWFKGGNNTLSVDNTTSVFGNNSIKFTGVENGGFFAQNTPQLTPGQAYTLSAYVKTNFSDQASKMYVQLRFSGSSGFVGFSPAFNITGSTDGYIRVTSTMVAPAGTIDAQMIFVMDQTAAPYTVNVDGLQMEYGSVATPYFDGSSINSGWRGTPNNSISYDLANVYFPAHSTDTVLRAANNRAHTTDTLKRSTRVLSQSTDTLKRKATIRTHTTDVLKKVRATKAHATDINKRKALTKTQTTDVLKRKSNLRAQTTDTLKRKVNVQVHTTDLNLRQTNTLDHSTDVFMLGKGALYHNTDTNLRAVTTVDHGTDVNARKAVSLAHTTDTLKRKTNTKIQKTDVNKRKNLTKTATTDVLKRKAFVKTHLTDVNKRKSVVKTHATDINKQKSGNVVAHTTDTTLRKVVSRFHATDVNKRKVRTVTQTTDVAKRLGTARLHNTDVNKRKAGIAKVHSTDVNKRYAALSRAHFTDIVLRKSVTRVHTTDVNLRKTNLKTQLTDVLKRLKATRLQRTDVNKRKVTVRLQFTDTLKRKLNTRTFTTDTVKRKQYVKVHTTDVLVRSQNALSHGTSISKKFVLTIAQTTDVLKRSVNVLVHTTDSFKRMQRMLAHRTDVNKVHTYKVEHSTDVYLTSNLGKKKVLINGQWLAKPVKSLINGVWDVQTVKWFTGSEWKKTDD